MSKISAVRDRKVSFANADPNPVAVAYPDDVVTGDVLIAIFSTDDAAGDITAVGWTSLGNVQTGANVSGEVFYRTATGGEAGATFEVSQTTSGRDLAIIVMSVKEDLNPGTPEAATAVYSAVTDDFDPPSLSPSGGDRLYQWIVAGATQGALINVWDPDLEYRIMASGGGPPRPGLSAERLLTAATYDPAAMAKTANSSWAAWTIAIPIDDPGNAGYPDIETVSQDNWASSSTTQSMTLPAGIAVGDVLIAIIGSAGTPTVTITGWTQLATDGDSDIRGTTFQRVADGTEGASVTVNFSGSTIGSYYVRRISAADGTKTEATVANGVGQPTWPTLTPAAGSDKVLWVADVVIDGLRRLLSWPHNYGGAPAFQDTDHGVFGGSSAVEQASAEPGDGIIFSTGDNWVAFTAAVYTDGSGPEPPPSGGGNRMGDGRAIRKPPRTPR